MVHPSRVLGPLEGFGDDYKFLFTFYCLLFTVYFLLLTANLLSLPNLPLQFPDTVSVVLFGFEPFEFGTAP